MKSVVRPFRLDAEKLDALEARGVDLPKTIRALIDWMLEVERCPMCGTAHEELEGYTTVDEFKRRYRTTKPRRKTPLNV